MRIRLNGLVLIAAAVYACTGDRIIAPVSDIAAISKRSSSLEPPQLTSAVAYGPEQFIRHAGAPDEYSRVIDLSHFEGPFTLHITNGSASGANLVKAGEVSVNGAIVLDKNDLAALTGDFTKVFAADITHIAVRLTSVPTSYLTIRIEGHPRRWRVCPGETYFRTYNTVQAAVAAADPGATIWVCDGIHDAAAIINKPLTIRSEHSGAATLRDTLVWSPTQAIPNAGGTKPVFWVDGISSGTFRVADINFQLRQSAINVTGTWDKVEFDSVNIEGVDSAHVFAVRSFPSTVAGAELSVTRTTFTRLSTGVFAVGGTVNVTASSFNALASPVVYTETLTAPMTGAIGRVDSNTLRSCGQFGCIQIAGRGGVTIIGNTIEPLIGGPVSVGIRVSSGINLPQIPVTIENNDIVGPAPSDRIALTSWLVQGGIQYLANGQFPPSSLIIRGNRISNVARGITTSMLNGSTLNASDNVITDTFEGIRRQGNGPILFRRNDVTSYVRAFGDFNQGTPSRDYKCNWWGSLSGPVNAEGSTPPPLANLYVPWAMQPIAGTPVVCDPSPPVTVLVCAAAIQGGPLTFATIAEAYSVVATGGTILICDGTHAVRDLRISKSVTVRAQGPGKPILDAGGARTNFSIRDVVGGPVVLRSLNLRGTWLRGTDPTRAFGANVNIEGSYSTITIEDSDFFPSGNLVTYQRPAPGQLGLGYNSGVWGWNTTGNGITVRNNTFTGGDVGVGGESFRVRVEGNTFVRQSTAAVHLAGVGMNSVLENNEISECGTFACVAVYGGDEVTMTANRIRIDMERQTYQAIQSGGRIVNITANTITGTGGSRNGTDLSASATFPITFAAIGFGVSQAAPVISASTVTIASNIISGASSGIAFSMQGGVGGTASASVHDNVITESATSLLVVGTPGTIALQMHRNDFSGYTFAFRGSTFSSTTFLSANVSCNWWGQASGPNVFLPTQMLETAQPYASQPIAGRPEISCP